MKKLTFIPAGRNRRHLHFRIVESWGKANERRRKEQEYFTKLLAKHSVAIIRQVLAALAREEHFIPARRLRIQDIAKAPLRQLLRPIGYPWFYFESIRDKQTTIEVDVSHGIQLAASGETFIFERTATSLVCIKCYGRWIS